MTAVEHEKRLAAEAAAELVEDGMRVGLGTGSTVAFLLEALAARSPDIRCVATSVATEHAAERLGIPVEPFDTFDRLDLAIDGVDQISPDGWLVKGRGGAHPRQPRRVVRYLGAAVAARTRGRRSSPPRPTASS